MIYEAGPKHLRYYPGTLNANRPPAFITARTAVAVAVTSVCQIAELHKRRRPGRSHADRRSRRAPGSRWRAGREWRLRPPRACRRLIDAGHPAAWAEHGQGLPDRGPGSAGQVENGGVRDSGRSQRQGKRNQVPAGFSVARVLMRVRFIPVGIVLFTPAIAGRARQGPHEPISPPAPGPLPCPLPPPAHT